MLRLTQATISLAVISTVLSILHENVFQYVIYIQIVFQLQNTNYFC